ncbi:hypothetical protein ON010_g6261 [Phytophthora cinnamomi]|nr:hypothetical protein ON010_g6261 [Phytophthora cinnamomi]
MFFSDRPGAAAPGPPVNFPVASCQTSGDPSPAQVRRQRSLSPVANMFATGEPDESSSVPVFDRRSFVDGICFGGESFDDCLETMDRLLRRFEECRISISFTKSIFVQPKVDFLSHEVTREGIRADPKKLKAVTERSFPRSKKGVQAFLSALNYYSRFIQDFAVHGAVLYQLKNEDFMVGGDLSAAKRSFAQLQRRLGGPASAVKGVLHAARRSDHPRLYAILDARLGPQVEYTFRRPRRLAGLGDPTDTWLQDRSDGPATIVRSVAPCEPRLRTLVQWINQARQTRWLWQLCLDFVETPGIPHSAASAYLETSTVNLTEYTGMNNGVSAALEHGSEDLIIVGDSRRAIRQYLGVIACRKESLMTQLNKHKELTARLRSVKYLHAIREFNAAADSLASETLEKKASVVVDSDERKQERMELNRIREVIYETSPDSLKTPADTSEGSVEETTRSFNSVRRSKGQRRRVRFADEGLVGSQAGEEPVSEPTGCSRHRPLGGAGRMPSAHKYSQDEELRWSNLKAVLRGEEASLGYQAARGAWKMADKFVLSEDGLLYLVGANRRWGKERAPEDSLRLVVPTPMDQESLQDCHDSLEGGHQGIVRTCHRFKADYYWIGLFAGVEKHCPFTGFVMGKAMADTSALCVAKTFEECVYRRFGAPSLIRHDRDPRFMRDVFQAFTDMMQTRSRATLNYWPQASGQQERSLKTVMQVRVYVEGPPKQVWDEIVEKLIFAINNSHDATRKDTPFYFVRGWDARSSLRARVSSLKRGLGWESDALAWRPEQLAELRRVEREAMPRSVQGEGGVSDTERELGEADETSVTSAHFNPGDYSWEPDQLAGAYEVEAILDDRVPLSNSTERSVREFLVKWADYDEPSWDLAANLSCGGLLYDYLRGTLRDQRLQMVQVAD